MTTRRAALVGAFSSLFIPPAALALIQPAIADQSPMTAYERANFHMAEFGKAMDELMPAGAHHWNASFSGGEGKMHTGRNFFFRVPDPDASQRLGREMLIDRIAEFR